MNLSKNKAIILMLVIDIIGIVASFFIVSLYDIISIDLNSWVRQMQNMSYLEMYDKIDLIAENPDIYINYPPIYPTYLYLIRNLFKPFGEINIETLASLAYEPVVQFLMKSFSIIGFIIAQVVLYKFVSVKSAVLWSINYPFWLMSFIWGQRDALFCFLIVMLLYTMEEHKVYAPSLIFALMCLLKPQGVYFIFILGVYLVTEPFKLKDKFLSLASGACLGIISFLPFMIYQKDILLPFKLYLGVSKTGGMKFGCQAPNLYWLFNHVQIPEKLASFSVVLLVIAMITSVLHYRKTKDISYTCFFYLFSILMYNVGQHERYILYSYSILFYICFIKKKEVSENLSLAFKLSSGLYALHLTTVLYVVNDGMLASIDSSHTAAESIGFLVLITSFATFVANIIVAILYFKHIKNISKNAIVQN